MIRKPPTLHALLRRLIATWRVCWRTLFEHLMFRAWRLEAMVPDMDEVPLTIRPRRAYLVGTPSHHKWLVFDCPCGDGHRILLNLDASRLPIWTLQLSKTKVLSLRPSVNYHDQHRTCHYILSNGRIRWVRPRTRTRTETGVPNDRPKPNTGSISA